MNSKYIDIGIAVFMAYFAYSRFMNEQYGFAALFAVLCILNVVTTIVKHKNAKKNAEN